MWKSSYGSGLAADHTTVWRWVQRYGPELELRIRRHLKATNQSWRVDETYVNAKGRWCYLYRAIDSAGATIDFLLSAFRDADAAKRQQASKVKIWMPTRLSNGEGCTDREEPGAERAQEYQPAPDPIHRGSEHGM